MNIQEIISDENLKPITASRLKEAIAVFNEYFFSDPFKSSKKVDLARIIAEIVLDDKKFHQDYFDSSDTECFQKFDEIINENATYNYQLDPDLTPEEFKENCKPCPMIRPLDIDDEKLENLNSDFFKTIEDLTSVNYYKMYGFTTADPVDEEPEIIVESQSGETLLSQDEIEKIAETQSDPIDISDDKSIVCTTNDLLAALKAVSPGLGSLENENLIRFETDRIRTYSNNISVIHPFITGIEGTVAGKEILALITKVPQGLLTLSQDEDKLYIKGIKEEDGESIDIHFNFNALRMPPVVVPDPDQPGWKELPSDFTTCANIACMSTSTKARNFVYNCISVSNGKIYACEDGRKGMSIRMNTDFDGQMNIHGKLAKVLVNYPLENVFLDQTFFHFISASGTIVSLKQYADGEFADVFFNNLDLTGDKVEIPKDAKKVTERAAVLSGKKSQDYICITITKDKMEITGTSEAGGISEEIPMKDNEIEAKFYTNPALLSELFGKMDSMDVCEDYVIFRNGEINCWISKVIPV